MNTSAKDTYRASCENETSIPIFSRPWWLDAVCGDAWDVCLIENSGSMVASMPYHFRRNRLGMYVLSQPPETQTLGPWVRKSSAKYATRLGQEKDLLLQLIDQLPTFAHFEQNWSHSCTNWLPFYWRGFQQTTRYTYRIADLSDLQSVWSGFRDNVRSDIRKAASRFGLSVRSDIAFSDFLRLNHQTFARQGLTPPYSDAFIRKLDAACAANNARKIFVAVDDEGRSHAGVYIVWDEQSAYYLLGGGEPTLRSSGATSLCMWEAIQFAATVTRSFDFEGSMLEPVERFFRAFGAIQTPYFTVAKTPSRLLRIHRFLRGLQ